MLFEWFPELNGMDHSFNQSVFAENRSRLLAVAEQARQRGLRSAGPFSVDGTVLIPRHGKSLDIAAECPAPRRISAVWGRRVKKCAPVFCSSSADGQPSRSGRGHDAHRSLQPWERNATATMPAAMPGTGRIAVGADCPASSIFAGPLPHREMLPKTQHLGSPTASAISGIPSWSASVTSDAA